jgi:diguanylate cyclase
MLAALIGIVTTTLSGVTGAGLGWLLHGFYSGTQLEVELAASKNRRAKELSNLHEAESGRTAELMAQLAELTTGVASELGKHSGSIEAINAELAAARQGDTGAVVSAVQKILKANAQMQQELQAAENRLQEQQEELAAQTAAARTDQLTKITNRRAFDEELRSCVLEFQRSSKPFSIMMLDVDHFKKFNDTHGHLAGDEVLKFVAQTLKSQAKDSEVVARYGGEEFVLVFRGETVAACRERADQLRGSINQGSITFEGKELRVAASAGIAEIGIGEDEKSVIRRADEALYASKKAGRNCAHWNNGRQNLPVVPPVTEELAQKQEAAPEPPRVAHPRVALYEVRFSDYNFSPNLDRLVAEWKKTGQPFSLAVCAIDGYDDLREAHGDHVLRLVTDAATSAVTSCLREKDHMAGFNGGSFAISLPETEIQEAAVMADRVRRTMERVYVPNGILPRFTASVGVAQVIEGNDSSRIFDRAQRALDAAQRSSVNTTFIHDGLNAIPSCPIRLAAVVE